MARQQIPMRELNQHTADVMARVERGEVVEITRRGRPIACLIPVLPQVMSDLIAAGAITPPAVCGPVEMPTVPAVGPDAADLVAAPRDEERW